jgi:hypothetical protein
MKRALLSGSLLVLALAAARPAAALSQAETDKIIEEIDLRQHNTGDYASQVYLERKERNKNDINYEALVYRRGANQKLVILFQKPKEESGKGYLRIDKNLFVYDPTVGKWERRTERERIAGTDSRRNDFDESRFHVEFTAQWVADEKLGKYDVHHIRLTQKPNVDVAFPIVEMWVDAASGNIMKQQEFALSNRLMRTSYYPKWDKVFSESKGADVYVWEEALIKDEVEVGNQTRMKLLKVDLHSLEDSIFTKAWLEARSR